MYTALNSLLTFTIYLLSVYLSYGKGRIPEGKTKVGFDVSALVDFNGSIGIKMSHPFSTWTLDKAMNTQQPPYLLLASPLLNIGKVELLKAKAFCTSSVRISMDPLGHFLGHHINSPILNMDLGQSNEHS